MEIEAKFVIPDRDAMLRLQRVVRLGPFVPGDIVEHEIKDIYLDTQDRTLYQRGYACRLRHRAGSRWLTIKGLGGVEEAIHSRFESEQLLPADATEVPTTWPEGEGRALVLDLIGSEPLLELIVVEQVRQVRPLRLGERLVAELSLDQATICAGEQCQSYRCLEAELDDEGEVDDLRVLAEHLSGTWGLVPEPRSKFELGLALLEPMESSEEAVPEAPMSSGVDDQADGLGVQQEPEQIGAGAPGLLPDEASTQPESLAKEAPVQEERVAVLSVPSPAVPETLVEQGDDSDAPPEAQTLPDAVERVSESVDSGAVNSVEKMCERFQIDMDHARHVTEIALLLFDRTESLHHLDDERRRLLAVMATLHNVGLEQDSDRHHIRGKDIVLENRLEELSEMEQRMLAAAVFLHRKRIRRRKLEEGIVASLPLGLRHDTLVLAALVRIADGLDYSASHSTSVEDMQVYSTAVRVVVTGPLAEVDVARARAKADLWETLYGDTPFIFVIQGREMSDRAQRAGPGALAAGERIDLDKAKALKSPGVSADDLMTEAGRKVLAFHFARMLEHEPGTRAGKDIEELHDMRVATRRMRSAFRVFAPYYKSRAIRPYITGLRRTARALGPVRDLDVFMQKAGKYLDGLEPDRASDLDPLLDAWRDQREQARTAMIETLDSAKHHGFVAAFRLFLETSGVGAKKSTQIPPRPTVVRHVVPQLIYGRWASVQAFGIFLEEAPIPVLHALRIECKRLRYTLEFFREVLSPQAEEVIEAVIKLQDHLGDLNDADVANAMLSDFLFAPRRSGEGERLIAPGVVAYLAVKQRELQDLVETFPQAWQAFNQPNVRQALAASIAIL